MSEKEGLPQSYALRVAMDELEYLDTASVPEVPSYLSQLPHVSAFIDRPTVSLVMRHIQNFCWTLERWTRKGPDRLSEMCVGAAMPSVSACAEPAGEAPNLWIDMTTTYRQGFVGGISRVTLRLAQAARRTGQARPVLIEEGNVYEYLGTRQKGRRLRFAPGVTLLLADCFWSELAGARLAGAAAHAAGAKVVLCVHDIIPLYYPSFSRPDFVRQFASAMNEMLACCDAVVAVSRYTADRVATHVARTGLRGGWPLPVRHFHLGADGLPAMVGEGVSDAVREVFARDAVVLSVGTLEPRKGYAVSLDAFDRLWAQGIPATFVIVGGLGWLSAALKRRIREHSRFGKDLFWLDGACDADLAYAYRHAHCLLQGSICEGFGLPVVEAIRCGLPVVASDIPVFREIAGADVTYFQTCDAADLAEKLHAVLAARPVPCGQATLTWDESFAQLVAAIDALALNRDEAATPLCRATTGCGPDRPDATACQPDVDPMSVAASLHPFAMEGAMQGPVPHRLSTR